MLPRTMQPVTLSILLCLPFSSPRAIADEPVSIAGTWSWSYKDAQGVTHKHVLEVEGKGEKMAARERMDEEDAVKVTDLKVTGKSVTFSVLRGKRRASYSGKLKEDDLITGTVTVADDGQGNEYGWEAKKDADKKQLGEP